MFLKKLILIEGKMQPIPSMLFLMLKIFKQTAKIEEKFLRVFFRGLYFSFKEGGGNITKYL